MLGATGEHPCEVALLQRARTLVTEKRVEGVGRSAHALAVAGRLLHAAVEMLGEHAQRDPGGLSGLLGGGPTNQRTVRHAHVA